jgi:hypothetical protein
MKKKNSGRMSKAEWEYIEESVDSKSVQEIANDLNRDIGPIVKYIAKIGKSPSRVEHFESQAEFDLKKSILWKEIRNQFTPDELEAFLHHWKQIVGQFRKDILPTEELQIVDTIKLEILMSRTLTAQKSMMDDMNVYESLINKERMKEKEDQDKEYTFDLERQIAALRVAKDAIFKDYKDLQVQKDKSLKALKATREQRIEKLESNQETFASKIRQLNSDPEYVRDLNEYLEKTRIAADNEYSKLSDFHTFMDGSIDQCVLNSDNVISEVPTKREMKDQSQ